MNIVKLLGRMALVAGTVGVAVAAHATDFSTTESGYWAVGTTGSLTTLVDSFNVSATNSPDTGLTFDSGVIQLSGTGSNSPLTGSLYLYGASTNDYLEYSLTGEIVSQTGTSVWVVAPGTLTASGGAFSGFTTGSGGLSANYSILASAGGVTTGTSSSVFTATASPAPEPASIAALGMGLIGLRRLRRRK